MQFNIHVLYLPWWYLFSVGLDKQVMVTVNMYVNSMFAISEMNMVCRISYVLLYLQGLQKNYRAQFYLYTVLLIHVYKIFR